VKLIVIAQLNSQSEFGVVRAREIALKADIPWRRAVLTRKRIMANKSAPHSERKPLVILRKITLHRKACSLALLVGGMVSERV